MAIGVGPVGPFEVANAIGLVAFAMVGALKGADADLDFFGIVVLGVITAFGGGATRDVLVGRTPASLLTTTDVSFAFLGVALGVIVWRFVGPVQDHPAVLVPDAVGLAAFAATGALVGTAFGVSSFGIVLLATITGVGGGSIADLLLTRVPIVLREDFYATPALLGGVTFWGVNQVAGPPAPTATCVGVVLLLRLVALHYDWELPSV